MSVRFLAVVLTKNGGRLTHEFVCPLDRVKFVSTEMRRTFPKAKGYKLIDAIDDDLGEDVLDREFREIIERIMQ